MKVWRPTVCPGYGNEQMIDIVGARLRHDLPS